MHGSFFESTECVNDSLFPNTHSLINPLLISYWRLMKSIDHDHRTGPIKYGQFVRNGCDGSLGFVGREALCEWNNLGKRFYGIYIRPIRGDVAWERRIGEGPSTAHCSQRTAVSFGG